MIYSGFLHPKSTQIVCVRPKVTVLVGLPPLIAMTVLSGLQ